MKNDLIKKILPHVIAVLIFLIVSVFFCKPALEGNVLNQHDIVGWKGMAQNAFDYKAQHGHFPLWNTNVFGGMPNYLIAMEGKTILPDLNKVFSLGLPQPINFFFIACICFYILCLALRVRPVIGVFGALAFAFATYNPIIIAAGHVTKMFAIAYMPLFLAGLILTYEKKYWLGLALTTLGIYMQVSANHPQISYYLMLIAAAVTIAYLVGWIQKKEWKHIGLAAGITVLACMAGLLPNALSFLVTSEYSKSTIRGGKTIQIEGDKVTAAKKSNGLDTTYAFQYSLGKAEAVTVLMPNAFGGSSKNLLDENSKVFTKLVDRGVPENNAAQLASSMPKFWGDPQSTGGGPLYSGVIVCLLALIGFVLYKHPLRWGLLAISVIGILMAWGKNFSGFNLFLFDHLPLYNKFRSPSITMVIVQLTIPILAVLAMQLLFFRDKSRELLKADFRKILYTLGGLFVLLLLLYLVMDYSAPFDQQIINNKYDNSGTDEIGRLIVSGLKAERSAMFGGQLLRTFAFIGILIGLLWLYWRKIVPPIAAVIILTAITVIDQVAISKDYLGEDKYESKDELVSKTATKTTIDEQILADKSPHFRVYNAGEERFSAEDYHVSTFHKAIGGYHPAKLRIYQDLIERYLYGGDASQILNMLNTKYIIFPNPQTGQQTLTTNPDAYGPCWLVKHVQIVKDDVEEIQAIGKTNLKDTAIVQDGFAKQATQPVWDSTASITLSKFDNDEIEYAASSSTPQFAVFSEVYYPFGWNAYLDGKKVDYVKTDYVLRGLSLPAGKHTIRFAFEPATYKKGVTISYIGSYLVLLFVLGGLFMAWRERKRNRAGAGKA
jgi:multisubunit Na+/H+ antiporter MnhC subunit